MTGAPADATRPSTDLLERSAQLATLDDCLTAVTGAGGGRLVWVRGEAGIGKTAVLRAFCAAAHKRARVLWATCDALFIPRPLGPLLDLAGDTDGNVQALVDRGAKPHDVAAALLADLAAVAPTVLVLEDVHWGDEATLDVLRLVGRRIQTVPALLVASYRVEQLDRAHPLRLVLGELPTRRGVVRIDLENLSRAAVATLAAGSPVDVEELYGRTAGNPFYVTETLAAQAERVPDTVRDAVLARAMRLSSAAQSLLEAVAIVPHRVTLRLLNVLDGSPAGVLEECLASGMLTADRDGVAFRHELARLAVEDALTPDRRVALHRQTLSALAETTDGSLDAVRLAYHGEAAADTDAVLRFAPAAAAEAASVGARREAASQYARALRFAKEPALRADLLERLARELYVTDMGQEAIAALDEALAIHRAHGNAIKQGQIQRMRAASLLATGCLSKAKQAGREAIELLETRGADRELAHAYSTLSEIAMHADEAEEACVWGGRGAALAESVQDAEALALGLTSVGTIELSRGDIAGREKLERSLAVAKSAGLTAEAGRAYVNLLAGLGRSRGWAQAGPVIAAGKEYCRHHGLDAMVGYLMCGQAEADLALGKWTEAAETALAVLDGPPPPAIGPRFMAQLVLARVRFRRGDPDFEPLLAQALTDAETTGELQFLGPVALARAEAAWLRGRPDLVDTVTEDAYRLAVRLRAATFAGELAVWRWRAGIVLEAPPGIEEIYRLHIVGEWKRAAQLWSDAGYRYDAALARGDADDFQALSTAHDELRALGASPAAAIVARRLRERGARALPRGPRVPTRANAAGLTARELEVVALLVEGLRNADIAQRLVVSSKTVDHHVSAILRKLDVRSRGEAGVKAVKLGLTVAE